jgi:4-amino-4-deoxy-L-arabinose transferase-like glycosyltransferase
LILVLGIWLFGLEGGWLGGLEMGGLGLTDRDEGSNAEAAREMLETGDWISPTLNYEPRFHGFPQPSPDSVSCCCNMRLFIDGLGRL